MYKFDNQLPKTTTYWKEREIFYIKHTSFHVTAPEAYAIGELLKASDNMEWHFQKSNQDIDELKYHVGNRLRPKALRSLKQQ